MKAKWYIGALIVILTFFGAVTQQQSTVPNQEIVLQFTNASISSEDTKNTIATVKKQLQYIGVSNIKVKEAKGGKLIISYYSTTDVASIKEAFSKEKNLVFNFAFDNQKEEEPSKVPSSEKTIRYNFDIYEIQNGNDAKWDLNGMSVVELKPENKRFSNPNTYAFIDVDEINKNIEKATYRTHYNTAIAIDGTSHKIPEVRAGPLA